MEIVKGIEKDVLGRFKLSEKEINSVLDIIESQVEKSHKEDGLMIMEKDLILEKFCFLCIFEQWDGVVGAKTLGLKKIEKDIDDRIKTYFHPFKLESGIKNITEQEKNQQKYTAHLEAVKKAIIDAIYGNKI